MSCVQQYLTGTTLIWYSYTVECILFRILYMLHQISVVTKTGALLIVYFALLR